MTTKEGGTGLGLAVAHRIAGEHGGELTLDNPGEKGGDGLGAMGRSPGRVSRRLRGGEADPACYSMNDVEVGEGGVR